LVEKLHNPVGRITAGEEIPSREKRVSGLRHQQIKSNGDTKTSGQSNFFPRRAEGTQSNKI
jgi:hypothetical protein